MKTKLNHLGLLISNLEKSRHFYGNVLGFKEIDRPSFSIKGLWYDLGEFELHLMLHEQATPPSIHPLNETVQPHFALSVMQNELLLILSKLKKFNIQIIAEPTLSPAGVLQVFFYDYDKNMIELNDDIKILSA